MCVCVYKICASACVRVSVCERVYVCICVRIESLTLSKRNSSTRFQAAVQTDPCDRQQPLQTEACATMQMMQWLSEIHHVKISDR